MRYLTLMKLRAHLPSLLFNCYHLTPEKYSVYSERKPVMTQVLIKTFLPFARASHFKLSCTNLKLRPCFFSKSFSTVNHQVGSEPEKAQINISSQRKLQPVGNSFFTKVVGKLLAVLCASFLHFWRESSEAVQPVGGQVTTRGNSGRLFVGSSLIQLTRLRDNLSR